jgi:hypothetical protein
MYKSDQFRQDVVGRKKEKEKKKKTLSLTHSRPVPQRFFKHVLDTTDTHCNVINYA